MGALPELIKIGSHFFCIVIDMALILLVFRIIGQWRHVRWVETVNHAAKDIVDPLTAAIGRQWRALVSIRLSPRGALAASMFTLCVARFVLQGLAGLLT
jgi:hypothetical protein